MQSQPAENAAEADNQNNNKKVTFKENKLLYLKLKFFSFLKLIWDNKNKEFLMRNFQSWGKFSFFKRFSLFFKNIFIILIKRIFGNYVFYLLFNTRRLLLGYVFNIHGYC